MRCRLLILLTVLGLAAAVAVPAAQADSATGDFGPGSAN
jgi:hypothetical protein